MSLLSNIKFILTEAIEKQYPTTIALVPGSFKPPHAGHLDMVKKYAAVADKVVVLISAPKSEKSLRKTKTGNIITPEIAKEIFELYIKRANLNNVEVIISPSPAPVTAAMDYAKTLDNVNVIFGASDKNNNEDTKRWQNAEQKVGNPNIKVMEYIVPSFKDISATTIRDNIDNIDIIKPLLPSELSDSDIEYISKILS